MATITEGTCNVFDLILLPDGKIASASNQYIKIWDPVCNYNLITTISGHNSGIHSLRTLNNGSMISASWDKTIKIWDKDNYKCVSTLTGHTDYVQCLLVLSDTKFLSGSNDNTIKVWSLIE